MNRISKFYLVIITILLFVVLCKCTRKSTNNWCDMCTQKEHEQVCGVIMKAYHTKMFSPKFDKDGYNLYVGVKIINYTNNTLYLSKSLDSLVIGYPTVPQKSLFYSYIGSDTLRYNSYGYLYSIKPKDSIEMQLHKYIRPNDRWYSYFDKEGVVKDFLDTVNLHYTMPNFVTDKKLVSDFSFVRNCKYSVDTVEYNSYFEGIFKYNDIFNIRIIDEGPYE